jgi:hypothetical protein
VLFSSFEGGVEIKPGSELRSERCQNQFALRQLFGQRSNPFSDAVLISGAVGNGLRSSGFAPK